MRRVFSFDVLTCRHGVGKRWLLEATTEPGAIRKILTGPTVTTVSLR